MQPSRSRAIGNAGGSTHRALPATSRFPVSPSTVPTAGRTVMTPTTPAGPTPGLTFQIGEPVMLTNWVHDEYPKGIIVVIRGVERQAQSASMEPAPWHMSDNDSVYCFSRCVPRPDFKVYSSHTSDGAPLHTQVSTTLGGIPSVEQHAEGDFVYTLCHFNFTPLGGPRRNSELEVPTGTQCRVHALTTRTGTKYGRKINDPHWVQKSRYVLLSCVAVLALGRQCYLQCQEGGVQLPQTGTSGVTDLQAGHASQSSVHFIQRDDSQ